MGVDEQPVPQALAPRPYRSLLLPRAPLPASAAPARAVPHVPVERRALTQYDTLLVEAGA